MLVSFASEGILFTTDSVLLWSLVYSTFHYNLDYINFNNLYNFDFLEYPFYLGSQICYLSFRIPTFCFLDIVISLVSVLLTSVLQNFFCQHVLYSSLLILALVEPWYYKQKDLSKWLSFTCGITCHCCPCCCVTTVIRCLSHPLPSSYAKLLVLS